MSGEGGAPETGPPNDARGTEFNRVLVTLFEDARRRSFVQMFNAWTPRVPVEGDSCSAVDPDTIKELVALAKADNRADFDFLAGAAGVHAHRRDALWAGTRARLGRERPWA